MSPDDLTPRKIVEKLDQYIIGQQEAKRAVAIALRNRWRRQNVSKELGEEISPKNIIMIGPTGVGKTEIARRLAKLDNSPFIKVEASKFTEVGYVGRDVESMVRDLVELAINMVKSEEQDRVRTKAAELAEDRLLDILLPAEAGGEEGDGDDPQRKRDDDRGGVRAGAGYHPREARASSAREAGRADPWRSRRPRPGADRWWRSSPPPGWRIWGSTSRTCSAISSRRRRKSGG